MSDKKLMCEIITPERTVFSEMIDMAVLTSHEGEVGILPLHAPLVTILKTGEVRITVNNEKNYIATGPGFAEFSSDKLSVLVENAELAGEIDIERAQRAREEAQRQLESLSRQEGFEFSSVQADLEKALNRIRVAGR